VKLSYVLEMLASGELANLNLAADGLNIKPERKIGVLRAVNAGLIDLHTRFLLKKVKVEVLEMPKEN
jgi:alpha-D-ribose 1-methylphosphonate 5-triphosphate synthase subunit PhnG